MMRYFISYARVDAYLINQLVGILYAGGHEPWYDHKLLPGQDWKKQLLSGIDRCSAFIYALTPESVASEWCQWEFARAVERGKPVIPVLFQANTQMPEVLSRYQYVDFTQGPTPETTARLLAGLASVVVTIPLEDTPRAPANPQGLPSRAPDSDKPTLPTGPNSHPTLPRAQATRPARSAEMRAAKVQGAKAQGANSRTATTKRRWLLAGLVLLLIGAGLGILVLRDGNSAGAGDDQPASPLGIVAVEDIAQPDRRACTSASTSRLAVGTTARIAPELGPNFRLRVRSAPGLSSPTSGRVYSGTIFTVVDGPYCTDGLVWWKIQVTPQDTGWAAEGDSSGYYMVPLK